MAELRFTILGCGSSGGVPRIGGHWGACDPDNPKNRRRRCALLVERETSDGITRALIDTGPDLREQLLDAGIAELDAVIWTHAHADHTHGLDDLRQVVYNMKSRLDAYADAPTKRDLLARFGYAFTQPEGSSYPPILTLHDLPDTPFKIKGAGGTIPLTPFRVNHGAMDALGFRIHDLAYLPDIAQMNETAWQAVENLDCWILDALRRAPHPTHAHLSLALDWISRAAPKRAILTNMHIDLDHATIDAETPPHITPAHDGMVIRYAV